MGERPLIAAYCRVMGPVEIRSAEFGVRNGKRGSKSKVGRRESYRFVPAGSAWDRLGPDKIFSPGEACIQYETGAGPGACGSGQDKRHSLSGRRSFRTGTRHRPTVISICGIIRSAGGITRDVKRDYAGRKSAACRVFPRNPGYSRIMISKKIWGRKMRVEAEGPRQTLPLWALDIGLWAALFPFKSPHFPADTTPILTATEGGHRLTSPSLPSRACSHDMLLSINQLRINEILL